MQLGAWQIVRTPPGSAKIPGTNSESTALRGNIEAATVAIERLRKLAQVTGEHAKLKSDRPWHPQKSWRDMQKNPPETGREGR